MLTGNPSDTASLPRACQLVADAAAASGVTIDIKVLDQSSRTAEEAAAACGTTVGQIVKSLVFAGAESGKPVLLLVSGANRVKEGLVGRIIGEKIVRPDADFVRDKTGFAIGGIPPFGHAEKLATYIDEDMMAFDTVWAAAGTPNSVFEIRPTELQHACGASLIAVTG